MDDFAIAGPQEKCLAKLRELGELGVEEVSCAYLNGERDQMERVGRETGSALAEIAASRWRSSRLS